MTKLEELELEIDWVDPPRLGSIVVPRPPAVPTGLDPSQRGTPPVSAPRRIQPDSERRDDDVEDDSWSIPPSR